MLLFNLAGLLVVYGLQRLQGFLPLNPQAFGAVSPDSSFNTAVSFATNTNWQGYGGETTMSYLTQMLGLTVQNFVSAATGMAVLVAFIRGLARHTRPDHRQLLGGPDAQHALHPAAAVARPGAGPGVAGRGADLQPVPDRSLLQPTVDADGKAMTEQALAVGPAASQIAIKQLGTNGGGFFNVNSAHPFENPTPLSNFLEMLAILLIPAALVLHLRQDGRRYPAGLGAAGGHDDPLRRPSWPWPTRPKRAGNPRLADLASISRQRRAARRQHGRQGGPLRRRQLGPLGHGHHRRLQRLGQLDARLLHPAGRPGAAGDDACWARWSSAAWARGCTACWSSSSWPSSSPG